MLDERVKVVFTLALAQSGVLSGKGLQLKGSPSTLTRDRPPEPVAQKAWDWEPPGHTLTAHLICSLLPESAQAQLPTQPAAEKVGAWHPAVGLGSQCRWAGVSGLPIHHPLGLRGHLMLSAWGFWFSPSSPSPNTHRGPLPSQLAFYSLRFRR